MKLRILYPFIFLLLLGTTTGYSQADGQSSSAPAAARDFSDPYVVGESLSYVGKYKRFGFAFTIAELDFTVSKVPHTDDLFVVSEARSKGTLSKLFNFKFYQKIESTIESDTLQVGKTIKRDEQRDRIRDSEALFDFSEKKVNWVETDPNDPARPPKRVASTITSDVQDIVTAVYVLRGKKLAVGTRLFMRVSDSGLVYDVPVMITAREKQNSILGKIWCWRVDPEIFGDGHFIEQKGSLTIWITDDTRRIPVRARLNTELGRVDIKLEKFVSQNPLSESK